MPDFYAQTLSSNQLLALLYICECNRKDIPLSVEALQQKPSQSWKEMLSIFAERFANLEEQLRFEVLEAHLMSVEDIDVYNNSELRQIVSENQDVLTFLTDQLNSDSRFQS